MPLLPQHKHMSLPFFQQILLLVLPIPWRSCRQIPFAYHHCILAWIFHCRGWIFIVKSIRSETGVYSFVDIGADQITPCLGSKVGFQGFLLLLYHLLQVTSRLFAHLVVRRRCTKGLWSQHTFLLLNSLHAWSIYLGLDKEFSLMQDICTRHSWSVCSASFACAHDIQEVILQVRHDYDEPDFATIDTLFSLAEAHLFMQLVELRDTQPGILVVGKSYADIYRWISAPSVAECVKTDIRCGHFSTYALWCFSDCMIMQTARDVTEL